MTDLKKNSNAMTKFFTDTIEKIKREKIKQTNDMVKESENLQAETKHLQEEVPRQIQDATNQSINLKAQNAALLRQNNNLLKQSTVLKTRKVNIAKAKVTLDQISTSKRPIVVPDLDNILSELDIIKEQQTKKLLRLPVEVEPDSRILSPSN